VISKADSWGLACPETMEAHRRCSIRLALQGYRSTSITLLGLTGDWGRFTCRFGCVQSLQSLQSPAPPPHLRILRRPLALAMPLTSSEHCGSSHHIDVVFGRALFRWQWRTAWSHVGLMTMLELLGNVSHVHGCGSKRPSVAAGAIDSPHQAVARHNVRLQALSS